MILPWQAKPAAVRSAVLALGFVRTDRNLAGRPIRYSWTSTRPSTIGLLDERPTFSSLLPSNSLCSEFLRWINHGDLPSNRPAFIHGAAVVDVGAGQFLFTVTVSPDRSAPTFPTSVSMPHAFAVAAVLQPGA
jgi:hypothetical protein